jgi:hypothetical protein
MDTVYMKPLTRGRLNEVRAKTIGAASDFHYGSTANAVERRQMSGASCGNPNNERAQSILVW